MQERKEAISPTKNFSSNRVLERKFKGDNDTEMIYFIYTASKYAQWSKGEGSFSKMFACD